MKENDENKRIIQKLTYENAQQKTDIDLLKNQVSNINRNKQKQIDDLNSEMEIMSQTNRNLKEM